MALAIARKSAIESSRKNHQNKSEHALRRAGEQGMGLQVPILHRSPSCACGGGCPRCQRGGEVIQTKLRIGQPNDKYEQEADRVADQVMRMPEPKLQRQPEEEIDEKEELFQTKPLITPLVQRQVDMEEDEEEEVVQTQPQITPLIQCQIEPEEEEEETIQTKPFAGKLPPFIQRQVEPEEEEEEPIQAKQDSGYTLEVTPGLANSIQSLRGGGYPLPESTRSYFESRFGYDFQGVRFHISPEAVKTAGALNARAFTIGSDVMFGAGQYSPKTQEGQRLIAHELTHVVQQNGIFAMGLNTVFKAESFSPDRRAGKVLPAHQSPNIMQQAPLQIYRSPDQDDKLDNYLKFLRKNKRIEGKATSKSMALEAVEKSYKVESSKYWLPDDLRYLLIVELLRGGTKKAHRDAILEVLERITPSRVFKPSHVDVTTLANEYKGAELKRLQDFFNRRFEGGLKQVKAGNIKVRGRYIPAGIPLSSLDIVRKTITWLRSNKKTAAKFFGDQWSAKKIILLGEMHFDDVQRMFAADMLKMHGGSDVGLALEIHISLQHEIDYYIKHGNLPKNAKGWWRNDAKFKKIIEQAKSTKTQVIAMDTAAKTDRDAHMAKEVKKLAKSKRKILVYVGAMHLKEAQSGFLGGRLASQYGGSSYAIEMFHPDKDNYVYWMIKDAFVGEKSIGFDIDSSPLDIHKDPDITKYTFGDNLDGYIYYHSSSSYK